MVARSLVSSQNFIRAGLGQSSEEKKIFGILSLLLAPTHTHVPIAKFQQAWTQKFGRVKNDHILALRPLPVAKCHRTVNFGCAFKLVLSRILVPSLSPAPILIPSETLATLVSRGRKFNSFAVFPCFRHWLQIKK